MAIVQQAFMNFDRSRTGSVDIRQLKQEFRAHQNPIVVEGRLSAAEATEEFFESFDANHQLYGGYAVTLHEFVEFYTDLSSCIENDQYFVQLLTASWLSDIEKSKPKQRPVSAYNLRPRNHGG